jgi:hypothetical protein
LPPLRRRGRHHRRVLPPGTLGQAARPGCAAERFLGRGRERRRRHSGRAQRSAAGPPGTTGHGSARAVRRLVGGRGSGPSRHGSHRFVRPLPTNGLGPTVAVAPIAVSAPPGLRRSLTAPRYTDSSTTD